jgi:hypothetical protein
MTDYTNPADQRELVELGSVESQQSRQAEAKLQMDYSMQLQVKGEAALALTPIAGEEPIGRLQRQVQAPLCDEIPFRFHECTL